MFLDIPDIIPDDWWSVQAAVNQIRFKLGTDTTLTHAGLTLTDLTASSLIGTNASKTLESVTIGTGLDYTRPTLSLSHLGVESLTDPDADKILFWDDSETACKWLGVGNSIAITTTTLDTIQDIRTSASPTFVKINCTDEDNVLQVDSTTILRFGTSTNYNIFIGEEAFNNDDGEYNIAIGYQAGYNSDSSGAGGDKNVYIGYQAAYGGGSSSGNLNTAIGYQSLFSVTTGYENFALGYRTLTANTSGNRNVGIGSNCLILNSTGEGLIGIGAYSLQNNTASYNTAIGYYALNSNTSGTANIGIGTSAEQFNQTGHYNTSIGYQAGKGVSGNSYSNNTFIGFQSGCLITTGSSNIFIGNQSGYNQTTNSGLLIIDNQDRGSAVAELTNALIYGVFNATVTNQSLRFNVGDLSLVSGTPYQTLINNTHEDTDGGRESRLNFKGEQSGGELTTLARIEVGHDGSSDDEKGYLDIFINDGDDGDSPTKILRIGSTGLLTDKWLGDDTNTFLGINVASSGNLAAGGVYNTGVGYQTFEDITTGVGNTAIGYKAVANVTTNSYNTGIGYHALFSNTGQYNTAIGKSAGSTGDGNSCVFLGYQAGFYETGSNKLFIDNVSRTNEADGRVKALIYGVFDAAVANQSLTINAKLNVNGSVNSGTSTFSTEGPTDNVDVSGVNTLFLDCSANDVTIGGFTGGVDGQVLYIARLCAGAFSAVLEHIEGGGSQDIYLHAGADETLDTEYGGWILVCNGTSWFDTSHAKHV